MSGVRRVFTPILTFLLNMGKGLDSGEIRNDSSPWGGLVED